jgi:chromosomal replication initiation ATPase DnaA
MTSGIKGFWVTRDSWRKSRERIPVDREIAVPAPRAKFPVLLHLTAKAHGASEEELVRVVRQRKWVRARSMLVYLGREWGRVSVKELGRRLHRDPSIISRLYSAYAAARDEKGEAVLLQQLRAQHKRKPDTRRT